MSKQFLTSKALFNSKQHGFSQIAVSDGGKHVFISGQVAWDENSNIFGENDLKVQTRNLSITLKLQLKLLVELFKIL